MKAIRSSAFLLCSLLCASGVYISPARAQSTPPAAAEAGVPATQSGTPKLRVVNPVVDWGTVEQGKPVEVMFSLKNEGSGALEILQVQPACGCTATMVDNQRIEPGSTGTLRASLDTKDFSGRKSKTVRISTNDPQNRSVVLTLEGVVSAEYEVTPVRLFFGKVRRGEAAAKSVKVVVHAPGVELSEVTTSSPEIQVTAAELSPADKASSPTTPAERGKELTVTLSPNLPLGQFSHRVMVKTSSQKFPLITIPLFAFVEGDFSIIPPTVGLGLVEVPLKGVIKNDVRIAVPKELGLHVLKVESSDSSVQAQLKEVKKGEEYLVTVSVPQDIGEKSLQASVKVTTDHTDPVQREITIPVNGTFVKRRES